LKPSPRHNPRGTDDPKPMTDDSSRNASIADEVLDLLRCPVSLGPIERLSEAMLQEVNQRIAAGGLTNQLEQAISRPLDDGLYSPNAKLIYPMWDGIPTLIAEEAIGWP